MPKSHVMVFRLHQAAMTHLRLVAQRDGVSMGEVVREALYQAYGIDELACASISAASLVPPRRAGRVKADHA